MLLVGEVGKRQRFIERNCVPAGEIATGRRGSEGTIATISAIASSTAAISVAAIGDRSHFGLGTGQKIGTLAIALPMRAGHDDVVPLLPTVNALGQSQTSGSRFHAAALA